MDRAFALGAARHQGLPGACQRAAGAELAPFKGGEGVGGALLDMLGYERGGRVGDDDGRVEEEDADERGDGGRHLRHAVKCTARHRARRDEPEAHRQIDRPAVIGDRVREIGCPQGADGVQAREREEHPYEERTARVVRVLSILGLVLCIWKGRARYRMEIAPGPGPAVAQAVEHRGLIVGGAPL